MILYTIDWTDARIIAAFIGLGGVLLTSIISILMVFCKINQQKRIDDKRHKSQLLEELSSTVLANMDIVIYSYKVYNERREKTNNVDTEENWSALQMRTIPRIEEAVKILNKIEVIFGEKEKLSSIQNLEDTFISNITAQNNGDDSNDSAYNIAKDNLQKQVRRMLETLS